MSLEAGLEVSKSMPFPVSFLCPAVSTDVNSLSLLQLHACLPSAVPPTMMVVDSNLLEL